MVVIKPTFSIPFIALLAFSSRATLGCRADPVGTAPRAEQVLTAAFPAHAPRIVNAALRFERRDDRFALSSVGSTVVRSDLDVTLPRRGEEPIALRAGKLAISVREIDAAGDGAVAGSAVAYPRAGGTSLWTATAEGAEEWLLLDAGVARADRVAAAWEVDGATLRTSSGVVEILDSAGVPRFRVTAPAAFSEGGAAVRATLSARGNRIELVVDGGGARVLADPAWSATGTMLNPRGYHASALLPSGEVLVAGGSGPGAFLAAAERFDPVTNAWSVAAPMANARMSPIATTLTNGRVLVAGSSNGTITAAELYDPATDTWSSAGAMADARGNATATRLTDGRVLYAGGYSGAPLSSAEIYDPNTNAWTAAAPLTTARSAHAAALLPSGKVLVAGGFDSAGVITSAEIYDPAADNWAPAAPMSEGFGYSTATTLPSGNVLVVGGASGPGVASARAEVYEPTSNSWSSTGALGRARYFHTASLLPTGQVVVAGGMNVTGSLGSTEIYDPAAGTWSAGPTLATPRNAHSATLLPNGIVLAAGGMNVVSGYLGNAESYGESGSGANGVSCGAPSDCSSGFCVDGVCCDKACGAGPCDACAVAVGADVNGTCKALSGASCNDANACSLGDVCQSGVCVGASMVTCPQPDECHKPGACVPATGLCTNPIKPDDTPCAMGSCNGGVCSPNVGSGAGGAASSSSVGSASTGPTSSGAGTGSPPSSATTTASGSGGPSASTAGGAEASASAGGAPGGTTPDSAGSGCSVSRPRAGDDRPIGLILAFAALLVARSKARRSRRA